MTNELTLKGRVWYEFDQHNAEIPILFLVGTGKSPENCIQNLINSYKEFVDSKIDAKVVFFESLEFVIKFQRYFEFLEKNLKIQMKAFQYPHLYLADQMDFKLYSEYLSKFVSDFNERVKSSVP